MRVSLTDPLTQRRGIITLTHNEAAGGSHCTAGGKAGVCSDTHISILRGQFTSYAKKGRIQHMKNSAKHPLREPRANSTLEVTMCVPPPRGRLLVPPLGGKHSGLRARAPRLTPAFAHGLCDSDTSLSPGRVSQSVKWGRSTRPAGPWRSPRNRRPGPQPRRPGGQGDLAGSTAPQTLSGRKSFGLVSLLFEADVV